MNGMNVTSGFQRNKVELNLSPQSPRMELELELVKWGEFWGVLEILLSPFGPKNQKNDPKKLIFVGKIGLPGGGGHVWTSKNVF